MSRVALAAWLLPIAYAQAPICQRVPGSCSKMRKTSVAAECGLYLAESAVQPGKLGLFTGFSRSSGDEVAEPELFIPMLDAKKNEWSPLHDLEYPAEVMEPRALLESFFLNDILAPGIGDMLACSNKFSNVESKHDEIWTDNGGVHRSKDPMAGSFSYYAGHRFLAIDDLMAGEELVLPCPDPEYVYSAEEEDSYQELSAYYQNSGRKVLSTEFLKSTAVCLDNLISGRSEIPGAGRGAFANRRLGRGSVVAVSPVVHFDRSQLEVVEQSMYGDDHFLDLHRDHGIRYTGNVTGQQLLLNYVYSHKGSNVMLFPYGPTVNYINHNHQAPNVAIRWSTSLGEESTAASAMKGMRPMELFATPPEPALLIEYVALRPIEAGEEILLDYGAQFEQALQEHVAAFKVGQDTDYVSAAEWAVKGGDSTIRTVTEQEVNPYPNNLQTACFFAPLEDALATEVDEITTLEWSVHSSQTLSCLRPCTIVARAKSDGKDVYEAVLFPMGRYSEPIECGELPDGGRHVSGLPATAIIIMDRPYTTDLHQKGVFRHEIGVPEGFFPEDWDAADPNPEGNFLREPLEPGALDYLYWKDTKEVVLQNAYRLGLPLSVRSTLLDYCEKTGIANILRHVTVEDNGLLPGQDTFVDINGFNWFLQRPSKSWSSNLHWLSPSDMDAHDDYLQALTIAGFDDMIKSIGEQLGLDGLAVYHVTFIAVSQSTKGYIHTDVQRTGDKTFNVIVPLIKATDGTPELDVQSDDGDYRLGRYPYEVDVAALMGDRSWHGTSAVDYRVAKEMRLAATIYITDVNEDNVESIMDQYTQHFPPSDPELLLGWSGRHWKPDDPTRHLPNPPNNHILLQQDNPAAQTE